jgi:hypothetical protein
MRLTGKSERRQPGDRPLYLALSQPASCLPILHLSKHVASALPFPNMLCLPANFISTKNLQRMP